MSHQSLPIPLPLPIPIHPHQQPHSLPHKYLILFPILLLTSNMPLLSTNQTHKFSQITLLTCHPHLTISLQMTSLSTPSTSQLTIFGCTIFSIMTQLITPSTYYLQAIIIIMVIQTILTLCIIICDCHRTLTTHMPKLFTIITFYL
jgi:hypothetical protein